MKELRATKVPLCLDRSCLVPVQSVDLVVNAEQQPGLQGSLGAELLPGLLIVVKAEFKNASFNRMIHLQTVIA